MDRYEDNIKMNFKEIRCESFYWIQLSQNKIDWWTFVNTVVSFRFRKGRELFQDLSDYREPRQLSDIAPGYGLDDRGSIPGRGWEFFSSTPCPERLWGLPSLLSNGYRGLFSWGKAAGS
jgi:hypothetical protein